MNEIVWRKPGRCDAGNCVEVAIDGNHILIRDSKNPDGPHLTWTTADWRALRINIRHGWQPTAETFAPLQFDAGELAALVDDIRNPQPTTV